MAVVRAAVAVLAEGAAEFTEHDHHRSPPLLAHLVGEGGQPAAEVGQLVGQRAGGTALRDVRVPTTHVDEAELHTLLHQARDAPSFHGEALAADRIATGTFHLLGHLAADLAAYLEAPAHRRRQTRAGVHVLDDFGLPLVNCRLAHRAQRLVGHRLSAAKDNRQLVGKGQCGQAIHLLPRYLCRAQHTGQAVEKAAAVVAHAARALAQLDAVLRFEMAA